MPGAVYDAGALIAAERGRPEVVQVHRDLITSGHVPVVPLVVLAEAWRGGPQPLLSRLLRTSRLVAENEDVARAAGLACAASGTSDVVDAIVVVTAIALGVGVVTSDPGDLSRIAAALGVKVPIVPIGR